ncbi:hypothetical protein HPB50_024584 [Hyalomma asiaticum]|uniref:Uncharacterized protein n=1 Tax=Hyalomma asiaticum TaxID=266040 RepID=A0ACB7T1D9_HYAAI|nr:hypothetical protein HPB50_024584 [Hyalomma asiaticum]
MSRSPINEGRNSPNCQRATPVELTPVHQRASRRLRGDSPEFAPLSFTPRETRTTDAATMTSQVPQPEMVVIRDPEPEPQLARHVPTYSDVLRQPAVQSSAPVATTVTYPPTARSTPRVVARACERAFARACAAGHEQSFERRFVVATATSGREVNALAAACCAQKRGASFRARTHPGAEIYIAAFRYDRLSHELPPEVAEDVPKRRCRWWKQPKRGMSIGRPPSIVIALSALPLLAVILHQDASVALSSSKWLCFGTTVGHSLWSVLDMAMEIIERILSRFIEVASMTVDKQQLRANIGKVSLDSPTRRCDVLCVEELKWLQAKDIARTTLAHAPPPRVS